MMHRLRTLRRNSSGIAAVEFAFVAPIFMFMTTGAIDMGYIQWGRSQLSGAAQVAGRKIIQSKSGTTAQRKAAFTKRITDSMVSFKKPASQALDIQIRKYSNFSSMAPEPFDDGSIDADKNGQPDGVKNGKYDKGETFSDKNANNKWDEDIGITDDLGGVGDVIKVDVSYPLKPLFSYNAALFGKGGAITIKAATVFRNEPE